MKKIHSICCLLLIVLAILPAPEAPAQTRVAVVSREISGQEPWSEDMQLEVNGENAKIYIDVHSSNSISWEIHLSARHTDRKIAERDLSRLKWIADKKNRALIMRNFIELERGDQQPESFLEAVYHLKVPEQCNIEINEYFGEISVKATSGRLEIKSKFAPVKLEYLSGNIQVQSDFGDVTAKNLAGETSFVLNRANLVLSDISGGLNVEAEIAEINLESLHNLNILLVLAEKSEIYVQAGKQFRYILNLKDSDFTPADWMPASFPDMNKIMIHHDLPEDAPYIEIHLNVGKLNLK